MLLRSSSNPSLNSWFQQQNPILFSSSPEPFFKSPTLSLHSTDSPSRIVRASSESDLVSLSLSKRRNSLSGLISSVSVEEDVEAEEIESRGLMFSTSGLDGAGGGGKICGGGGSGGGGNGGCYDGSDDRTDVYYQNMIETNPANSLILTNYAKYLKEVKGDILKAEEYCSRAILANPNDGTALSMYADLVWETQKDASRARTYFDQAVKASPDDCYVMASYARFLWDADEEDEEQEGGGSDMNLASQGLLQGASQQFPVAPMAAASWG